MLFEQTSTIDYYFVCNWRGDVIRIYDGAGAVVANYNYDAWGGIISVTDANGAAITDSTHIANVNPLRYRGYYFDSETGLYYLQSRYYDPVVKRFINADGYVSTGTGALGYNMFAYCLNNSVLFFDKVGSRPDVSGDLRRETPEQRKMSIDCMNSAYREDAYAKRENLQYSKKEKPNFVPRKDQRKGSENRQKTGARERNVRPEEGEEHSRVAKGTNTGVKRSYKVVKLVVISAAIVYVFANDATGYGVADDFLLAPLSKLWWDTATLIGA